MSQPVPLKLRLVVSNPTPTGPSCSPPETISLRRSTSSPRPETTSTASSQVTLLSRRLIVLDALNPNTVAALAGFVEGLIADERKAHQRDAVAIDE
jgi:hypothetical protein